MWFPPPPDPLLIPAASRAERRSEGHAVGLLHPGGRAVPQGLRRTRLLEAERPALSAHQSDSLLHLRGREHGALPTDGQVRPRPRPGPQGPQRAAAWVGASSHAHGGGCPAPTPCLQSIPFSLDPAALARPPAPPPGPQHQSPHCSAASHLSPFSTGSQGHLRKA